MAMSWVAEKNTMATAHTAMGARELAGFCSAKSAMPAASAICMARIQPRRRPRKGSG